MEAGSWSVRNVDSFLPKFTALHPIRNLGYCKPLSAPWKPLMKYVIKLLINWSFQWLKMCRAHTGCAQFSFYVESGSKLTAREGLVLVSVLSTDRLILINIADAIIT
jgi:hypothetical protein